VFPLYLANGIRTLMHLTYKTLRFSPETAVHISNQKSLQIQRLEGFFNMKRGFVVELLNQFMIDLDAIDGIVEELGVFFNQGGLPGC
jgi:hypothetical protein